MSDQKITGESSGKGCRYHKKGLQTFSLDQITPDNLCIHAFHSVYSSCLKLFYTNKNNLIKESRLVIELFSVLCSPSPCFNKKPYEII